MPLRSVWDQGTIELPSENNYEARMKLGSTRLGQVGYKSAGRQRPMADISFPRFGLSTIAIRNRRQPQALHPPNVAVPPNATIFGMQGESRTVLGEGGAPG
jgi:hypothetical protein